MLHIDANFPVYKTTILHYVENFLEIKRKEFSIINSWGKDVCDRFLEFISQGKMLRGSLLFASYALFTQKESKDVVLAAAAIELFQSSLIVHDDIMDGDTMRRGKPTIWMQYGGVRVGEGMAICFGDIGFFLAYELLSNIHSEEVTTLFSKELSSVVLAQMQDVSSGFSEREPTKEEIITLYRYKTGRYTFSLPLMTGAILAKQNKILITQLEKIGELLGILFQLKDDELGLFGDEKETGKPLGSDIRENKKTVHRLFLLQKLSEHPTPVHTTNDFKAWYNLYRKYHIQQEVKEYMNTIEKKIKEEIKNLPLPEEQKKLFYELLVFSLERKK